MDANVLFKAAGAGLEQAQLEGGEFRAGELDPEENGIVQGGVKPVGRSVQDQPELVGERAVV